MICVLMMASGAAWESDAFARLTGAGGVVVLKRCVDVDDLLATATSGQADVAVIGLDAPGLDPSAIAHLRRYAVRPVAVAARAPSTTSTCRARAERLGITALVAADDLDSLAEVVSTVEDLADTQVRGDEAPRPGGSRADRRAPGRGDLGPGRGARSHDASPSRWPPSSPGAAARRCSSTPIRTAAASPSSSASSTRCPACCRRPGWPERVSSATGSPRRPGPSATG